MSEAAELLRLLAARVDTAADALRRADFLTLADAAAELDAADLRDLELRNARGDRDVAEGARTLRRSLDQVGALLGHVAGVQFALQGLDPAQAGIYDRNGAGVGQTERLIREEA